MNARRSPPAVAALTGAAALLTTLVACAQPPADPPPGLRVRVQAQADLADAQAFGERVARAAGTAVRDVAAIGPRTVTLTLICAGPAACDTALAKLRRATDLVSLAEPDGRMGIPRPIRPDDPKAR